MALPLVNTNSSTQKAIVWEWCTQKGMPSGQQGCSMDVQALFRRSDHVAFCGDRCEQKTRSVLGGCVYWGSTSPDAQKALPCDRMLPPEHHLALPGGYRRGLQEGATGEWYKREGGYRRGLWEGDTVARCNLRGHWSRWSNGRLSREEPQALRVGQVHTHRSPSRCPREGDGEGVGRQSCVPH